MTHLDFDGGYRLKALPHIDHSWREISRKERSEEQES
jgi:hypothetical protein